MKRLLPILGVATLIFAAATSSAHAQANTGASFSANLGVTNNYMWRGITQTEDDFAVQGGVDVEFENGIYLGAWGSNVDWGAGASGDVELDLYGGFGFPITDMLSGNVGAIGYLYPDHPSGANPNFFELNGGLDLDLSPVTLSGAIAFSPDNTGETTWNFEGGAAVAVGEYFELFGNLGYYEWEVSEGWMYYVLGASATWQNFGLSGYITGTDISGDDTEFVIALTATVP